MRFIQLLMLSALLMAPTCDSPSQHSGAPAPAERPGAEPATTPAVPTLVEELAPKPSKPQAKKVDPQRAALLPDKGIWSELDSRVWLAEPQSVDSATTSIVVDKRHRVLTLLDGPLPLISYPIALGFTPEGDKIEQGDGRTPEGDYYLCEMLDRDLAERYGARSMRLSYPNVKDAARGLADRKISQAQHDAIARAIEARRMPPQNTALGSSIRIHGGGVEGDWTAGCVALRDDDVIDLYGLVRDGTEVRVIGDRQEPPFGDRDGDGVPDVVDLLLGAKKAVLNGSEYDGKYVKIPHAGGDVPREIGVCTDVIVRALRNAGLDLQIEVQADRSRRPKAYPRIKEPNPSIDHRRVKNLWPWFARHWKSLPIEDPSGYRPGDVVLMDTLPADGPDHIGIVSDRLGESGKPLVINNWTVGHVTAEMDLLDWVEVTHRYRWPHR